MWSKLSSKSGLISLQKLVRVVFKTIVGNPWVTDDASKHAPSCLYKVVRADLKMGPSRPGKVVRVVFKKWLELSLQSGQN